MEFEFDTALDTAADVATEMEEEMELTPEDAAVIATTIRNELERLSALPQVGVCGDGGQIRCEDGRFEGI